MLSHFHLWLPNIFQSKGGIQTYSRFLLQALQHLYPHCRYDVCLKHDTVPASAQDWLTQTRFHCSGHWPLRVRTPLFALQLFAQGIKQRPDLVIATHLNFTEAAYTLKQWIGTPYWAVAHGIEAWNIEKPALQKALQQADRILAVSEYTRDRLITEQHLDPDKVVTLANTFDADRFQIAPKPTHLLQKYRLSPEQPIILTVARLSGAEQYKGYDTILQALPRLRQAIPNIHYVLVGAGDDRPRVEQLIAQLQLQDCVTLAGYIPDAELAGHYNLCDVYAMPSQGEGFGIVYLEALASGKPTLGGNRDGALDALCHGELGVLINPTDVDEITHTLLHILQGTYPHPILYQPELLRREVIARFGFAQFQKTVGYYLEQSFRSL
jgi:glycosyltransferase involved in cell wall biosynthesis